MKKIVLDILKAYQEAYKDEDERLAILKDFLDRSSEDEITDWNNFFGHIVASAFVMSKKEKLFAVVYHDGLKMYVYPGGHIDVSDSTPLDAAKREVAEETGLSKVEVVSISDNIEVPFDIDTHRIAYNEKLDLPEHYHFDFRYFFVVDQVCDLIIDEEESSDYKWISLDELSKNSHYKECVPKLKDMIDKMGF